MESICCPCGALLLEISNDGLESRLVGGRIGTGGIPCCHACELPLAGESDQEILLRILRYAWRDHPKKRSEIEAMAKKVRANQITRDLCRNVFAFGIPGQVTEMPSGKSTRFPEKPETR